MGVHRHPALVRGPTALTLLLHVAVVALQVSERGAGGEAISNEDCLGLGFSDSLECDTCEQLQDVVGDATLYRECRGCCRVVSNDKVLFDSAKLQICD